MRDFETCACGGKVPVGDTGLCVSCEDEQLRLPDKLLESGEPSPPTVCKVCGEPLPEGESDPCSWCDAEIDGIIEGLEEERVHAPHKEIRTVRR